MSVVKEMKIEIPYAIFESAQTKEELEDWLLAHDAEFIKRMRKARADDLEGKGKDWAVLKRELCTK
jgi:hypothetical protein